MFKIRKISLRKARLYAKLTFDHKKEIDQLISENLNENWHIERLNKIDLILIRILIAEKILFKIPPKVTINEVINLAKKFSDETKIGFINGIGDKLTFCEAKPKATGLSETK